MNAKNIVVLILILILVGTIGYFIITKEASAPINNPIDAVATSTSSLTPKVEDEKIEIVEDDKEKPEEAIGKSANGLDITAYHFGTGEKELLFIGGIHGGYSWNTSLLAYEMIDYLTANPDFIPKNITLTVIPTLNPDGLKNTIGKVGNFSIDDTTQITDKTRVAGRFNANTVDINRNFDCDWTDKSMWQSKEVSGGTEPFSEPEAKAMRDYILNSKPAAVVVWFSAEGKVYPSACKDEPSQASTELASLFAKSANYKIGTEFNAYTINGDMVNWIASQNIPAISVLLTDQKNTEWDKNKTGIEAVINSYTE